MVFACYRDFLDDFKKKGLASEPSKLFAEGGPAWQKYKSEHAAEIAKAPKSKCKPRATRRKGKKGASTKKIRGSRKIMKMLLSEGDFDDNAKAEIRRLLGKR